MKKRIEKIKKAIKEGSKISFRMEKGKASYRIYTED